MDPQSSLRVSAHLLEMWGGMAEKVKLWNEPGVRSSKVLQTLVVSAAVSGAGRRLCPDSSRSRPDPTGRAGRVRGENDGTTAFRFLRSQISD